MSFDGTQILIGKGAQDPMSFKMLAGAFADAVKACFIMRQREKN